MSVQGGSFEGGLLIAGANTTVTNQLTVAEENMVTFFMLCAISGNTAGISFLGIAKHRDELSPVIPESYLASSEPLIMK